MEKARQERNGAASPGQPAALAASDTKVHVLENDDGCSTHLLSYMHRMHKSSRVKSFIDPSRPATVFIPVVETVVYENGFPHAWYKFDSRGHDFLQMSAGHLDNHTIFDSFSTVEQNCGGICCQFVSAKISTPSTTSSGAQGLQSSAKQADTDETDITYFTPDLFQSWIWSEHTGRRQGLLQKFVPPKGPSNDVLHIVWLPNVSTLVRITNVHALNSRHVTIQNKCCTYDAPPHLVETAPGNPDIKDLLSKAIEIISRLILSAEHKTISRFAGCFKYNREGTLIMLHATSVRVAHDAPIGSAIVCDPVEYAPPCKYPVTTTRQDDLAQANDPNNSGKKYGFFDGPRRADVKNHAVAKRRNTKILLDTSDMWTNITSDEVRHTDAPELQQLRRFVDEILYCLYAVKLAHHHHRVALPDGGARIQFPPKLAEYLGHETMSELMEDIFLLERVTLDSVNLESSTGNSGAGVFYKPPEDVREALKPHTLIRRECDAFIERVFR